METVFSNLIFIHTFISMLLFVPPIINLYGLFFVESHTKKMKYLVMVAPAYYAMLSASIFSGLVIWAMLTFIVSFKILAMLIVWVIVLVFEIKRHKRQKLMKVEANSDIRESFFKITKMKYLADICLFAFLSVI